MTDNSADQFETRLYRNVTANANTAPTPPGGLAISSPMDRRVTFSWNTASDTETPSNGLSYNIVVGTSTGQEDIIASNSDRSTGYRRIVRLGNTGENTSTSLHSLEIGTYYWSVQSVDAGAKGSPFATEQQFVVDSLAVTTAEVSDYFVTSAVCGGNITDAGDASVTARGVCWGTDPMPDFSDTCSEDGAGAGVFTSSLTGLQQGLSYYVRAYAVNSNGTVFGEQRGGRRLAFRDDRRGERHYIGRSCLWWRRNQWGKCFRNCTGCVLEHRSHARSFIRYLHGRRKRHGRVHEFPHRFAKRIFLLRSGLCRQRQ